MDWQRQLWLVSDEKPEGITYLILRDTITGGQPSQWNFWTLSEKLGTPQENCLLFVAEYLRSPDGEIWPPDTGAIANWFALGKPIGGSFSRAAETTHGVTVNRVIPATNWDPASGATVKGAGYVTKVRHDASALLPG